jgi:eukaryotic-like serine/threonine-protein kinase
MEGETLDGRYQLGEELGRGGHGVVYRATDLQNRSPAAVKVVRKQVKEDPEALGRLFEEVQKLAPLWGSSVLRVHGFGTNPEGNVYMATELLEGESFEAHLAELELFESKLSSFSLLTFLDPIARALHTAHTLGIVHRAFKPADVFLVSAESGGGVRLMDVGIPKLLGDEALLGEEPITGSPSYIAPEMWRKEPLDHRADVYSLGAIIFRALAGKPPFQAASAADLSPAVTSDPRPKLSPLRSDLSPEIDAWIERALSLDRDQRYPYVSTMWNDLIRVMMNGKGPSAERVRQTFRLPG